jgi:choline dehydrogenase-like flavoprotein
VPFIDLERAVTTTYDTCVIGSGPAGMAVAVSLAQIGHSVLLVEAGGELPVAGPEANLSSRQTHAPLVETNCRALGGTGWMWGGRIMPFLKAEFAQMNWPVPYDDYADYLDKAAEFLGGSTLGRPFANVDEHHPIDLNAVEMLAADQPISQRHAQSLDASYGPAILLSVVATGLNFADDADGGVLCTGPRVLLTGADKSVDLSARTTIIACGGVETVRLVLAEQSRQPDRLEHLKALGRGYCGHLTGSIAQLVLRKGVDPTEFGWKPHAKGGFTRQVFRTTAANAASGSNMFFWARNWPIEDAAHRSGIQSLKYVLRRLRGKGVSADETGPAAMKAAKVSPLSHHILNLVRDAPTSIMALPGIFRSKLNRSRQHLDHLIPNGANSYRLCYHAEQNVSDENLVELAGPVLPDQLPDIKITYGYSLADAEAVAIGHDVLAKELTASGLAEVIFDEPAADRTDAILNAARDGFHQIGTARMGESAADSVVDMNCKLHGVCGLYVAGSSIFPSSGAVPPTQSIVAFAMRLSDHLADVLKQTPPQSSVQ